MINKIKLIIPFIVLSFLSSAQSIDISIMSFNIQQPYGNNWDARKDSAVAILIQENMDIVGTQEAINSQRDYLLENTNGYGYFGLGRDGGDSGEGSWIFYKKEKYIIDSTKSGNFWLSDTPDVPSRFGGDYNRICTYIHLTDIVSERSFYIYNAHFPTPNLQTARQKSMHLMAQRMSEKSLYRIPILATGDFNSSENNSVTKWMKNGEDNPLQCRDTYRDFDPDGDVTTGFGTKYDYIYCENTSTNVIDSSWVVTSPSGASDHMPIAANISMIYAIDSNLVPIAHAGIDQLKYTQVEEELVEFQLDADGSFDPDGTIANYAWYANDSLIANGVNPTINLSVGHHPIYLFVTDSLGAQNSDQILLTVEIPINIKSQKAQNEIKIFPVPVKSTATVECKIGNIDSLIIYDVKGVKIMEVMDTNTVDLSSFKNGIYIFEISSNGVSITEQVIKE